MNSLYLSMRLGSVLLDVVIFRIFGLASGQRTMNSSVFYNLAINMTGTEMMILLCLTFFCCAVNTIRQWVCGGEKHEVIGNIMFCLCKLQQMDSHLVMLYYHRRINAIFFTYKFIQGCLKITGVQL